MNTALMDAKDAIIDIGAGDVIHGIKYADPGALVKTSEALQAVNKGASGLPLGKIAAYTAATLATLAVAKGLYDNTIGKKAEPEPELDKQNPVEQAWRRTDFVERYGNRERGGALGIG